MNIKKLLEKYHQWMFFEDEGIIETVLATVTSTVIPGDPVWVFVVSASGSLKTELLRALRDCGIVYSTSTLTKNSLIGGQTKASDNDLLPQLNEKCLVIKDFTTILTMDRYSRNEIFGQLRDCYDGYYAKNFGSVGHKGYDAHFSILAGVTPVIDAYHTVTQELGERFLKVRMDTENRKESTKRARENTGKENDMRKELSDVTKTFIDEKIKDTKMISISQEWQLELDSIAGFVAVGRTAVARDRNKQLLYLPSPEHGTRLVKQLSKLANCVAKNRGESAVSEEEIKLAGRIGLDCVPAIRLNTLKSIDDVTNTQEIVEKTNLPISTVRISLEDLKLLGMVHLLEKGISTDERGYRWELADDVKKVLENYGNKPGGKK